MKMTTYRREGGGGRGQGKIAWCSAEAEGGGEVSSTEYKDRTEEN